MHETQELNALQEYVSHIEEKLVDVLKQVEESLSYFWRENDKYLYNHPYKMQYCYSFEANMFVMQNTIHILFNFQPETQHEKIPEEAQE